MRKKRRWVAGALGFAVALIAAPAALAADGMDRAKPGDPPSGLECAGNGTGATTCFEPKGDVIWVKDEAPDGHSAIGVWEQDVGAGVSVEGRCRNKMGNETWGYCDRKMVENTEIKFWAVEYEADDGSWIDWSNHDFDIT